MQGGGYIYELLIVGILTVVIYMRIDNHLKKKKKNIVIYDITFKNIKDIDISNTPKFIKKYLLNIQNLLNNLDNPYSLNLKKYLFIKYIISILFFIISIINKNSLIISLLLLIITFYIPNILIKIRKNNEKILIIKNLRNIVNSIIISLSASLTLEEALKSSISTIDYKRLKKEFEIFVLNYRAYGYNMKRAINDLKQKFGYYEMELFISTLLNSEGDGNIMQSLDKFNMVLDISYSKYLAKENSKRLLYLTLGTILSLLNIIIIVMYPIFMEVSNNLQVIFK